MDKRFTVPYGKERIVFEIPESFKVDQINAPEVNVTKNPTDLVREALDNPVSFIEWHKFRPTDSVVIAINDKTRPVPHESLLPPLLNKLRECGISPQNILFIIASGTHIPMERSEYNKILSEKMLEEYPVICHNCDELDNLAYLGETKRKTPVYINKQFMNANHRIVIGNIEPHHFMGYSGGAKSAAIGLAGRRTIEINHSLLMDERAYIGNYDTNPIRQDVEEIGGMIGVDLALNAILNTEKSIIHAIAGDTISVMKAGISLSKAVCQVNIHQKYDFVIASAGGYPKDINLYQSQKALTHACLVLKDKGRALLLAECIEGIGSEGFKDFMQGVKTPQEIIKQFKKTGFKIGPHKAYLLARQLENIEICLYSSLDRELVKGFLLQTTDQIQKYIDETLQQLSTESSIAILPYATNTIASLV
jgi:nickel-dependent lactate racemase